MEAQGKEAHADAETRDEAYLENEAGEGILCQKEKERRGYKKSKKGGKGAKPNGKNSRPPLSPPSPPSTAGGSSNTMM